MFKLIQEYEDFLERLQDRDTDEVTSFDDWVEERNERIADYAAINWEIDNA